MSPEPLKPSFPIEPDKSFFYRKKINKVTVDIGEQLELGFKLTELIEILQKFNRTHICIEREYTYDDYGEYNVYVYNLELDQAGYNRALAEYKRQVNSYEKRVKDWEVKHASWVARKNTAEYKKKKALYEKLKKEFE